MLSSDLREDVNRVRAEGFLVEDDNDPFIEIIPTSTTVDVECENGDRNGNTVGFFPRESSRRQKEKASLTELFSNDKLSHFFRFLPTQWIEETLLPETSKCLSRPMSFGEFLIFIVTWLLMTAFPGHSRRNFFQQNKLTCTKAL